VAPAASDKITKSSQSHWNVREFQNLKLQYITWQHKDKACITSAQSHINVDIKRENVIRDETYKICALIIMLRQL